MHGGMVAERFRASVSNSSRSSLEDPGLNPTWGMNVFNATTLFHHFITLPVEQLLDDIRKSSIFHK